MGLALSDGSTLTHEGFVRLTSWNPPSRQPRCFPSPFGVLAWDVLFPPDANPAAAAMTRTAESVSPVSLRLISSSSFRDGLRTICRVRDSRFRARTSSWRSAIKGRFQYARRNKRRLRTLANHQGPLAKRHENHRGQDYSFARRDTAQRVGV